MQLCAKVGNIQALTSQCFLSFECLSFDFFGLREKHIGGFLGEENVRGESWRITNARMP